MIVGTATWKDMKLDLVSTSSIGNKATNSTKQDKFT